MRTLAILATSALGLAACTTLPARPSNSPPPPRPVSSASTFPAGHACNTHPLYPQCLTLSYIMNPDWSKTGDIIILPHRGYWGFGTVTSYPENSEVGYRAVLTHGYGASEVDFTPSRDGLIMSHDYVLTRISNLTNPLTYTYSLSTAYLESLPLKDRNGVVTPQHILSGAKALSIMSDDGTVVFCDLKQVPDPDPNVFARNWVDAASAVIETAAKLGRLYGLVFKTSYTPSYIKANLSPAALAHYNEVLWMPQVGSDSLYDGKVPPPGMGSDNPRSSADFVDLWTVNGGKVNVAAFEINYKTRDDSRLQPFKRDGQAYANLLDYARMTANRRGGAFAEEPVGERGIVNRFAKWSVKDSNDDLRGDFVYEALTPEWGNFIVVTTDRPDVWEQVNQGLAGLGTPLRP